MATGDNLQVIDRFRSLHPKLPSSAKLKATIAMTSLSSAITQAGMRRSAEAEKQLGRGIAEASSFIGLGPTNGNIVAMHATLMEMVGQATKAVQQFAAAAKRHGLPSVDTRGEPLPPPPPTGGPGVGRDSWLVEMWDRPLGGRIAIVAAGIATIGGIFYFLKTTGKI